MVPINKETNVEVLQQYTMWLEAQVKELALENKKLKGQATGCLSALANSEDNCGL